MLWQVAHRADKLACSIADRHYSRQKIGSPQCVPPGRCLVLTTETETGQAYWVTAWPYPQYVRHRWPGAWMCQAFRNEEAGCASAMISQAVAASQFYYGEPPLLGMVTFIDREKVNPIKVRGKDVWGWTWKKVGFQEVGETEGGLLALQLAPCDFPHADQPRGGCERGRHKDYRPRGSLNRDLLMQWACVA